MPKLMESAKPKTIKQTKPQYRRKQEITKINKPPHFLLGVSVPCGSLGGMATLEDHHHRYCLPPNHNLLLTEVSVPPGPAVVQFQGNTQTPTLIINWLAY